jgi:hypothetical protein
VIQEKKSITASTLAGVVGLLLDIRRFHNRDCGCYRAPYRPEGEGFYALPQHEFGLDVITLVDSLLYAEHRSVPDDHQALRRRATTAASLSYMHPVRLSDLIGLSWDDR